MIYHSAAVTETLRESELSEGDIILLADGAFRAESEQSCETVILFVNPGPLINTICAPLEDTVKT